MMSTSFQIGVSLILVISFLCSVVESWSLSPATIALSLVQPFRREKYDYDVVTIGAGASGLFAAGTASSVGFNTLMIERAYNDDNNSTSNVEFNVGGDCTNAACVPSKSIRSIARMAATSRSSYEKLPQKPGHGRKWLKLARQQANDAVNQVRAREDPSRIGDAPNLELEFVKECQFISDHKMKLTCYDNSTWIEGQAVSTTNASLCERIISSKKFIIATGASPVLPKALATAAADVGVPYLTYRSLLRPKSLNELLNSSAKNIAIVGGGATACELGQSLSRLGGKDLNLSIVAPELLPNEDITLQQAAIKVLSNDNCKLHLGSRAVDVIESEDGSHLVMDDGSSIPVDCIIFCTGRSPEQSLRSLHLDKAGVEWTENAGVTVNPFLRSKSARHVYACGDCSSVVTSRDRCSIHAGWTGFRVVCNALLPWFLHSPAAHPFVPRVTYLDPEIASAGMSAAECIQRFGVDGYDSLLVPELGSDRADVESRERSTAANFCELRAEKISGRLSGASACGPAAAEMINEVCLALVNRLTVRDIARTLHSYPSHGYMLYRISMALATQKISGLLAGCGTFGRFLGAQLRFLARVVTMCKFKWLPWRRKAMLKLSKWQAEGSSHALILQGKTGSLELLPFLDAYNNETLCTQILSGDDNNIGILHRKRDFIEWVEVKD